MLNFFYFWFYFLKLRNLKTWQIIALSIILMKSKTMVIYEYTFQLYKRDKCKYEYCIVRMRRVHCTYHYDTSIKRAHEFNVLLTYKTQNLGAAVWVRQVRTWLITSINNIKYSLKLKSEEVFKIHYVLIYIALRVFDYFPLCFFRNFPFHWQVLLR